MAVSVKRGRFEGVFGQGDGLPLGLISWAKAKLGVSVHWEAVVFAGWAAAMISKTLRCVALSFLPASEQPASEQGDVSPTSAFC